MKDCSSCPDSVKNRPELEGVAYDETPCAGCEVVESSCGNMHYGEQFENPTEGTWRIIESAVSTKTIEAVERLGQLLRDGSAKNRKDELVENLDDTDLVAKFLVKMSYRDIKTATLCGKLAWNYSYSELGEAMKCSKQAAHKAYIEMCENVENIYKEIS